jgi:hypothetical protein
MPHGPGGNISLNQIAAIGVIVFIENNAIVLPAQQFRQGALAIFERRLMQVLAFGSRMARLTNNFLFKDRCALPDQMSFVLTFPWRAFVFAMRNRDRTNLDEIAIFALSVTTKDFPHDMLL